MSKVATGISFLDSLLAGGYDCDTVTTLYGPSGAGKTNMCLVAAISVAAAGKKVLFIDTEGGIAVERIKQLTPVYEQVLSQILFLSPMSFEEQKETFKPLREQVHESMGLIVVDSISMLYRLQLGLTEDIYEVNTALGLQIAYLVEIARRRKIPVLITTQVYADFDKRDQVKMVGGDLLKYGSKCLLELRKQEQYREIILRKHRSLPEGLQARFKIVQHGIEKF